VPADHSGPSTTIKSSTNWMRGIAYPTSLSRDGRTLLVANDVQGTADVLAFDVDGGLDPKAIGAPRDFVVTNFHETGALFSPNGNLVAYTSDESGVGGGERPRWSSSGGELYYVSGRNLMSVAVDTAPTLRASSPHVLFAIPPLVSYGGHPYDVSPDGMRFLMLKSGSGLQRVELRVVVNWIDELERAAQH
jgi:Tol biopolymer transport system component